METQGRSLKLNPKEIEKNKKIFLERLSLYKSYGYDQVKNRKFVMDKIKPVKGRVLEIGTGKGHFLSLLAKEAEEVITVDIDKEGQKFAALNTAAEGVLDKITFCICDAGKLPYTDNSFNLVVSVNTFHHLERPFEVLQEMIRVCAKKLVMADFNKQGFSVVRSIHQDEGHQHQESGGDFDIVGSYLKEKGFGVKEFDDHCQKIYVAKKIKNK